MSADMRAWWLARFSLDEIREMAQAFAFVGIDQEPCEDGDATCAHCGGDFTRVQNGGMEQVYCGPVCRKRANNDRLNAQRAYNRKSRAKAAA